MGIKASITCLLGVWLALSSFTSQAADTKSGTWEGLKKMMSTQDFHAAGLDKLSTGELHQLDQWLLHFLAYDSPQVIKSDDAIRKLQKVPVKRRIAGHFGGWDGATVFKLDNGEVWKQRLPGRYATSLESPEVEIIRNLLGFYELRIVKTRQRIGVTRVK